MRAWFLVTMTAAFTCALLPGTKLMGTLPLGGHLIHLVTFMVLAFLLDLSYISQPVVAKVAFLSVLGALIEVAQGFVPYRSSSFVDFTVDMAGILIYFLFARWLAQRFLLPLFPGLAVCPTIERGLPLYR